MEFQPTTHPEKTDELLTTLANRHCRSVLFFFQNRTDDVCSLENLAAELGDGERGSTDQIAVRLRHSTLPRLEDLDAVEYDSRSETIRYRESSDLERLLGCISAL